MSAVIIPKTATAKELLKGIDSWAASQRNMAGVAEARNLWAILTALRGPDSDNYDLKLKTTAVIRHHVLPRLSRLAGALCERGDGAAVEAGPSEHEHFDDHIAMAVKAILAISHDEVPKR